LDHESQGQAAKLMDELVAPLRVEIPPAMPAWEQDSLGRDLHQSVPINESL
jgi:hypothetical protein